MKPTTEQKQANKEARKAERLAAKDAARIDREKNQKHVKSLTVSVEWKKSRTWGNNPTAEGRIEYVDGTWGHTETERASGCGYDKESTVIAGVFNQCLKYKLWELSDDALRDAPYGITKYNHGANRHYAGGVGVSCYYAICEYLGGEFTHTASGKTFDVYTAIF